MLPRYIGLCGYPESGKSLVQKYLFDRYCVQPIDDGRPLRDACKALYGLSEDDVTTQEGKRRKITLCGQEYEVRDLLGTLGNRLEETYGQQILPELAIAAAEREWGGSSVEHFSFGSVRKIQGHTYRKHGGLLIEVVREGTYPRFDFDRYDRGAAHYQLVNPLPLGAEPTQGSLILLHESIDLMIRVIGLQHNARAA